MKSIKRFIAVMIVSTVSFMAFAEPPKVDYAALGNENTPDNSVVMIFVGLQKNFDMIQLNPKFGPDKIRVEKASGVTTPMKPGSYYMVDEMFIDKTAKSGSPCLSKDLPLPYLNGEEPFYFGTGSRIMVPSKAGLYISYMLMDEGDIKLQEKLGVTFIGAATSVEDLQNSKVDSFFIRKILKKAAEQYAGTPWEKVINDSIEEWK